MAKAWRRIDFLIPLPWQCTTIEPGRALYAHLAAAEAEGALSASICMGFPAADTPVCGPSVLAYAAEAATAEAAVEAARRRLRRSRAPLRRPALDGRRGGVAHAMAQPTATVILADTQDNPGGGGSADTTGCSRR